MNEPTGKIFSLWKENPPVTGCTISKELIKTPEACALLFSLGAGTSISPTRYETGKLIWCLSGSLFLQWPETSRKLQLSQGDGCLIVDQAAIEILALQDCVFLELSLKTQDFNSALVRNEVFPFASLISTSENRIINMDIAANSQMKFVLMSFGAHTGLPTHAANHDALLMGVQGDGTIQYDGKSYALHAGEAFGFAPGIAHAVQADTPFKMALLMELDAGN